MGECYVSLFRRDKFTVVFYTAFLLWLYMIGIAGVWAVDGDALLMCLYSCYNAQCEVCVRCG